MRPARSHRSRGQGLSRVGGLALLVLAARSLPAQAIGQGFELERAGQFAQAAAIYFATLRAEPTNLSALLGLERVLPGLGRLPELLSVAQRATTASPANGALRSVLLRTYVGLNEPDSARAVAQRWIAAAPRDEAPYREWAIALEDQRRHEAARAVLVDGRRALGRPEAFGIELAELAARSGEWEGAAREWAAALSGAPAQLPYAASELGEAPAPQRDRIARVLTAGDPPALTRRLAGELLLNWGQPERAWAVYAPSLAAPSADAAVAARHFADLAAARTTPAARRVRALALARYAELATGPVAGRARAEAARPSLPTQASRRSPSRGGSPCTAAGSRRRSSCSARRGRTPETGATPRTVRRRWRCSNASRPTASPSWAVRCWRWRAATPPGRRRRCATPPITRSPARAAAPTSCCSPVASALASGPSSSRPRSPCSPRSCARTARGRRRPPPSSSGPACSSGACNRPMRSSISST